MGRSLFASFFAASVAVPSAMAVGQVSWVPGSEIVGQSAQVQTNGVVNTVHFDQGGAARIITPAGNTIGGTWSAANGRLCLGIGTTQECWPYTSPFQAGEPVTLTSSCQSVSIWTALATNQAPPSQSTGERG